MKVGRLAIWMAIVALYFAYGKKKRIKFNNPDK
jgi:hypothetical protein